MNGKPFCLEAARAHEDRIVWFDENKTAHLLYEGQEKSIPLSHQYNLIEATFFGLNERLTLAATSPVIDEQGTTLRDLFNDEWEKYNEAVEQSNGLPVNYGYYAYYPHENELVVCAPPYWHKIVSVASSSKLIADSERKMSWKQIREIFETTTVAIAGCSVGSNIAHLVAMDLRPNHLKVADKSLYKMENINRVRLGYRDIVKNNAERGENFHLPLQNKAEITARQIQSIDPFMNIHVYPEGVHEGNSVHFFDGEGDEPKIDIIVEEVDDPRVKIFLRQEARKRRVPLLMVTDIGSCVQLDILRYDLDANLPLTFGTSDEKLLEMMEAVYANPGNKKAFFDFVDALIGMDYHCDELQDILEGKSEIPTSTLIPQLGSTAAMAGAIGAETIARIRLGEVYPPRMIFNKKTFAVKKYE